MGKHTPGPWEWLNYPDGRKLLAAPKCGVIHCPHPMTVTDEDQALIAAAPDLLAACERAMRIKTLWIPLEKYSDPNFDNEFEALLLMRQSFKAAIKKAKGGEDE